MKKKKTETEKKHNRKKFFITEKIRKALDDGKN